MCKLTQFPLNTNWQRQVRMFSHSNVNEYDSDLMSNEDDDEDGDDKNKVLYLMKFDDFDVILIVLLSRARTRLSKSVFK